MRENRASHLGRMKTHPTILPRSGFEFTTVTSNMDKVSYALTHSATAAVFFDLKRGYIEFKYYADAIHSGLTPPG